MSSSANGERWREVWEAFHRILEGAVEQRGTVLEALARGDPGIAADVEELLAAHERPLPILDASASPHLATVPTSAEPRSAEHDWNVLPPGSVVADRFEILRHLESGGMGQVYKAHDRQLNRSVALKLVRSPDPTLARRFLREAEMQARIEHEHVCAVYAVGVSDDRPFIAMRYIDGVSLGEAASTMALEEKLLVAVKVSRALHAAHRQGLVHRDVKPTNVMLERREDGGWHPFVLDFGLARAQESPGLTRTGTAIGTPAYMAPEQALHPSDALDRRTDVWGLGATLYDAIAGVPPHGRVSTSEALARLLRDDPPPLRRLDPTTPADVETIVMRCLERDPARRYPSARAVAEDLERYLDGEPIEARPAGLLYRLGKRARKHRALVAVAAIALVAVLGSLTMLFTSRRKAAREAALSRRFGIEVEVAERILRHAYTSPLHDVRAERERVRRRLAAIRSARDSGDRLESRLASYSLGRAHLALREAEPARVELQRAWDAGYREPEVAHALGLSLVSLYQHGLLDLERLRDPDLRAARRKALDRDFRAPALELLRRAKGLETESPLLLEARLAYLDGRLREARELARRAWREKGWIYEARILEADVRRDLAERAWTAGDYDAASDQYDRARRTYEETTEIARSDPLLLARLCQLDLSDLVFISLGRGLPRDPAYERAVRSCGRALEADPESLEAGRALPEVHWRMAAREELVGRDPGQYLAEARKTAIDLLRRAADDPVAHNHLAITARLRGKHEMTLGLDPEASLQEAVAEATRAHELDPDFAAALNTLGGAWKAHAEHEDDLGRDPRPSLRRAIEAYAQARTVDPEFVSAALNAAGSLIVQAGWELERGLDPKASLATADRHLQSVLERNPRYILAYLYRGNVALLRARRERLGNGDPQAALAAATEAFQKTLAISPDFEEGWAGLGRAHADLAELVLNADRDPSEELRMATAAFDRAGALGYGSLDLWRGRVRALLTAAEWAERVGEDPAPRLARAASLAEDARNRFPKVLARAAEDDPLVRALRKELQEPPGSGS